jgi:hypothetical protein
VESPDAPTPDDRPWIIDSEVDPDVECVRVDDALAPSPPGAQQDGAGPRLCPEGYLPRRRRRGDYRLDGKKVVTDRPPIRNPHEPNTEPD